MKSIRVIVVIAIITFVLAGCSGIFGGGSSGGGNSSDDRGGELIPNPGFTGGLDVREGDLFELTFTAWIEDSPESNGIIAVKIDENGEDIDGDGDAFEPYFFQREVLQTEPVTYTKRIGIYQAANYIHQNARFAFDIGGEDRVTQSGTIYIDDVSLKLVLEPESFSTAVSSSNMRSALMNTIREAEDRQNRDRRFSDLSVNDITAYHLASLWNLDLTDDDFEDSGSTPGAFDLSTVDFSYFGRLRGVYFDDVPVTNSDVDRLSALTQIDSVVIGNTTGNENSFSGITNISPLSNLGRLRRLSLQEDAIPISNLSGTITPDNFPRLESLRIGLGGLGTSPPTAQAVDIFQAFGDAGHTFREVTLQNASLTNADFQSLYSNLLSRSTDEMEWLGFDDWDDNGQLDDSVLDDIGQLEELEGLELEGQAFTSISNLSSLTKLRELNVSYSSDLTVFSVLSNFEDLEGLYVDGTGFGDDDWGLITGLTNLERIMLNETPVTDISPLETLLAAGGFSDGGEVELGNRSGRNRF